MNIIQIESIESAMRLLDYHCLFSQLSTPEQLLVLKVARRLDFPQIF